MSGHQRQADRRRLLAGLAGTGPALLCGGMLRAQAQTGRLDPVAFFTGETRGTGTLREFLGSPKATAVRGFGRLLADGTFRLDQTVEIEDEETRERTWLLRKDGANGYRGTLSDAEGPVIAVVSGPAMEVRYRMDSGMRVEQVLTLAPGASQMDNAMRIRRFGITFATLDEVIRKV